MKKSRIKSVVTYIILLFAAPKRAAALINREDMTPDKLDAKVSREVWGES